MFLYNYKLGLGVSTVDADKIIAELKRYESDLAGILSRFTRSRDGIHINRRDDPIPRQYVRDLVDLFNDVLGRNSYSALRAPAASYLKR